MHAAPAGMPPERMSNVDAPTVRERTRPFDLVDLDGRRVRLDDLRGQAFLLIFLRHAG